MKIEDLKKCLDILQALDTPKQEKHQEADSHWELGEKYLLRTVTHIDIGRLYAVTDKELILIDASWVADTGLFEQCVKDGQLSEVEPFPDAELVIVNRSALIDAVRWNHDLPRVRK